MEIHELNTKSMTNPAYCALDDGSDTYKLDLNAVLNTMNTDIESDISAVDTKVQKKTRIWYASVSSQTGTPNITISGYDPGDNDYLVILFQFGNTSIKDVHIGAATYDIWYKGANTVVKADGGERVLYRIRTNNVVPYRLEYVGNHYDLATTSAKGLMSAADKAALDQAVSDVSDIQGELPNKADKVGSAPDLIAGLAEGLNTDEGTTIEEPYNLKVSGGNGREKLKKIVGVSVGWNQLAPEYSYVSGSTGKTTKLPNDAVIVAGHKLLMSAKRSDTTVNGRIYLYTMQDGTSKNVSLLLPTNGPVNPATIVVPTLGGVGGGANADGYAWLYQQSMQMDVTEVQITDLTLTLGSTIADYVLSLETVTAGAGVAWLKTHFPKMFGSYQPYDAGSIQSVTGLSAHKMTGFNCFDKAKSVLGETINVNSGAFYAASGRWRSDYIKAIPGTSYQITGLTTDANSFVAFYDADKKYISRTAAQNTGSITVTTPANCGFLAFTMYQAGTDTRDSVCCHLVWDGSRDGEFEPYKEWNYPLDDSLTLRGLLKLDANNSPYADGDIYEADGTVTRRYGIVDLGTLDWTYYAPTETRPMPQFRGKLSGVPTEASTNVVCGKYRASTSPVAGRNYDKTICTFTSGSDGVFVCDSAYSTAADFKAAMDGVMLVYELATPTTETAEPYTELQIVDGYGTEEFVSTSIVPVGNETFYLADLKGKLEDLPTIPEAPTMGGTYVLKATVSDGVAAYSWVAE